MATLLFRSAPRVLASGASIGYRLGGWGPSSSAARFFSVDPALPPSEARKLRAEQRFEALKELDQQQLYDSLINQFETSGPPGAKALCLFFEKCDNHEDCEKAVELITRFRSERVRNLLLQPFSEEVSMKLVQACIRSGAVDKALQIMVRANESGVVLSEPLLQQIMDHDVQLEEAQVDSVVDRYNQLQSTNWMVSQETTAVVLMTLLKGGEIARAIEFVETIVQAGQKPLTSAWQLVSKAASEVGLEERAAAIQQKL